jgi:leucyl-tRNA synthetase
MQVYNHKEIENKWQKIWEDTKEFECNMNSNIKKKYICPMFPYPSGNIHMGHMRNYTITDIISRYWREKGYNTFHSIGFDSFGMPAEISAIKNNIHPKIWTDRNIDKMREQMKSMGISFDWSREISTCDVNYWKHEQKFFIDMWNAGIIERKTGIVNWDPVDESVISNEQVIDGKGWRSGAIIERKEMTQYYFKTTDFAKEMSESISEVEGTWSEKITKQQKQFIDNGINFNGIQTPFSDWCVSRQRYWGTPIPMIHCKNCGVVPENIENTPVTPPNDAIFDGKGNPIDNHPTWKNCKCPKCGDNAERETDTMDTFVQSSWYFIRYVSNFDGEKFDQDAIDYWFPIDNYIGGAEHATSHMIYSRFFWRVFKKIGYIKTDIKEPFKNVFTQGMVKKDGSKMSKSAGNGVSPDEIIEKWGADISRMYIIFAAPPDQDMEWSDSNIVGVSRFMNRFWNMATNINNTAHIPNEKAESFAIEKIKAMEEKIKNIYEKTFRFNTIVSTAMETYNAISKQTNPNITKFGIKEIIKAIKPISPHICCEIEEIIK